MPPEAYHHLPDANYAQFDPGNDLLEADHDRLGRRRVSDREFDVPDPDGIESAATYRMPARAHAARESHDKMPLDRRDARDRPRRADRRDRQERRYPEDRRSGLVIVLALVAVSVVISVGLVRGLHLGHHSPSSVRVPALDSARSAPRFEDPSRAGIDGSQSGGDPDSPDDLDARAAREHALHDLDGPDQDDPGTDPDLGADKDPSSLTVPDDSSGTSGSISDLSPRSGTRSDGLGDGSDQNNGGLRSSSTGGFRTRQPSPRESYPDRSTDPDRSRPRLPGVDQDSVPGLGGL